MNYYRINLQKYKNNFTCAYYFLFNSIIFHLIAIIINTDYKCNF